MAAILQILTRPADALAEEMIAREREAGDALTVVDLTLDKPDYDALLEAVFAADRAQVW